MYVAIVALTMFLLPLASIALDWMHGHAPLVALVGKWFVFWGVGVRLGLAGLRQMLQPQFTAHHIFHIQGNEAVPVVRELGVANVAAGLVGIASLFVRSFVIPSAVGATVFYGLAAALHIRRKVTSPNEVTAMLSDVFLCATLAAFLAFSF